MNISDIPGIFGPSIGAVLPNPTLVAECRPEIQTTIDSLAPKQGIKGYFERIKPADQEYWFELYQNNLLDNLWVRRADGQFLLECTFPPGMHGQYLLGVYNSNASDTSISELGESGPAIALYSDNTEEITIIRQRDDEKAFEIGQATLEALVAEKYQRKKEYLGFYVGSLYQTFKEVQSRIER